MSRKKRTPESLNAEEVRGELNRIRNKHRFGSMIRSTTYSLVVVAAIAVLVATLWMPVLQTFGDSMTPTLEDGQIVISLKSGDFKQGDVVAFYYNNKILIRRVICTGGQSISIDNDGQVFINNVPLDEPYVTDPSIGHCNISFPYSVSTGQYFVLGDNRAISMDSRLAEIGTVPEDRVIGKVLFAI